MTKKLFALFCAVQSCVAIWAQPKPDTLRIAFVGDILLDRGVRQRIERKGADVLFSYSVDSLFAQNNLVVANLECPATKIHAPIHKQFIFRAEPEWLAALRRHGITHLNLANNHSIDQGRKGLQDTRHNVEQAGMVAFGAGDNAAEACQPVRVADAPRPVYLFASLRVMSENWVYLPEKPCVCEATTNELAEAVRRLKAEQPDAFAIVCLHWGAEHTMQPAAQQRQQAHQLIDAGADAIVGHHTHTAQTVETYRGKPIFYSLGNFIFDQHKPLNSRALVALLRITRDAADSRTVEVQIERCVPHVQAVSK